MLAIADATLATLTPIELHEFARATRGEDTHLLIVIDSLHAWVRNAFPNATEYDGLNLGISTLQQLAMIERCAIIVVCERNRVAMSDAGLHSSKGSAGLEYACETVWALSRDKNAMPNSDEEVRVQLTLAKNRNGSPGVMVDLSFSGGFMRFADLNDLRKLRPARVE